MIWFWHCSLCCFHLFIYLMFNTNLNYLRLSKRKALTFTCSCWFYFEGTVRKPCLSFSLSWLGPWNPCGVDAPFLTSCNFPKLSRTLGSRIQIQTQHHVGHRGRPAAPPGAEPGRGHQQSGGEVPEPGLRGSAAAVLRDWPAVPGRDVPGAAFLPGLQGAGSGLLQDPGCDLEETHGQFRLKHQVF